MADTPNTDLLNQFRQIVREEIEAEAKTTRGEIDRLSVKQTALEYNLSNKIKNVEISTLKLVV